MSTGKRCRNGAKKSRPGKTSSSSRASIWSVRTKVAASQVRIVQQFKGLLPQTLLEAGGQFSVQLFIGVLYCTGIDAAGQLADRGDGLDRQLGQSLVILNLTARDASAATNGVGLSEPESRPQIQKLWQLTGACAKVLG
jgi:hypothetical protein